MRLSAEALDGTVLEPGQVLSFDAVVGPRTLERGYQQAPVILHETRQVQVSHVDLGRGIDAQKLVDWSITDDAMKLYAKNYAIVAVPLCFLISELVVRRLPLARRIL